MTPTERNCEIYSICERISKEVEKHKKQQYKISYEVVQSIHI